jgi:uncharacterized membrane protein
MSKFLVLSLSLLLTFTSLVGHEEHKEVDKQETLQESVHPTQEQPTIKEFGGRPQTWIQWIGSFHFILVHFPIALIMMTGISEILLVWWQMPIFDYACRFMIIAAAVLAVPTALLGLIYSYTATYSGLLADFIWWHMWAGITTAILAIIVAFIRERYGISKLYYFCLILLFLLVNITGFFGGGVTFGPYHMYPPF